MPDYKLRSALYDVGYIQEYKRARFYAWYYEYHNYFEIAQDYLNDLSDLQDLSPVAYEEARKAAQADYRRNTRLKNRIRRMLSKGDCAFLTLTFTDSVLDSTTSEQRRLYVLRFLKSQTQTYIANIDFGSVNNREHYHCITLGNVDLARWTYGNIDVRTIIKSSNPLVLAKYINKLVNHAIKETSKRSHIIYSRRSDL